MTIGIDRAKGKQRHGWTALTQEKTTRMSFVLCSCIGLVTGAFGGGVVKIDVGHSLLLFTILNNP
jgi:hypothetical protein